MASGTITNNFRLMKGFCTFAWSLNSPESTPPLRLHAHWDDFVTLITNHYNGDGLFTNKIVFMGEIDFPAYDNVESVGSNFVWGVIDKAVKSGTVFMTHYGNLQPVWILKVHSGSYTIRQITAS